MLQMTDQDLNAWETEIIERGFSQSLPFGWFESHPIGGDMGSNLEDFEVTEIPAYFPCGSGEHLYLWIEKRGKTTLDIQKLLEKIYGVKEAEVGYAGKKDLHAITRQWFSVQTMNSPETAIEQLNDVKGVRVVTATRHTNKLRMGHLRGNHFGVNLYGVTASDEKIHESCNRLMTEGFLNYFGLQRFGHDGSNIFQGKRMLQGGQARLQQKKMYISALQSAVFNLYAARRFMEHGFSVLQGDVVQKLGGGCFICDDPTTDNLRALNGEIVVTGVLPGKKVKMGTGYTLELETRCSHDLDLAWPDTDQNAPGLHLENLKNMADGDRRVLWVRPGSVSFKRLDVNNIHIDFDLPSGSYATVLLRHLCGQEFTR